MAKLDERGVSWVTRANDNMKYRVVKSLTKGHENIIKDQLIKLQGKHKGMVLRREEIDGEWRTMVSMSNNIYRSPQSVSDIYRRRWDVEVFFKQVKKPQSR